MSVLKIKKEDGTWESIGGSSVDIDATLTQEGQAADAKAVGDRLDEFTNILVQPEEPTDAENGTLWIDTDEEDDGSGESEIFIVTVDPETMTASHSASEILAAVENEKIVIAAINNSGGCLFMTAITGIPSVEFSLTVDNIIETQIATLSIYDDKSIEVKQKSIPDIPMPTESDYGKVLSATAEGLKWTTPVSGDVPSAEGVEF